MKVGEKMNIKKITFLILVILLINIIFIPKTFAFSSIISAGDGFINSGETGEDVINQTQVNEVNSRIYNILLVCGIGVAVIVGAVLGITFILSSVEGKAKVSEALVPYIIGCVVVFGAFTIWKITISIGKNVVDEGYSSSSETTEVAMGIIDGTINVQELTDEQIKDLYKSQWISDDLKGKTTADSRGRTRTGNFNFK